MNSEKEKSCLDGSIAIRDGNVIVSNPCGFGRFPILTAGDHVEVYVNGTKKITPSAVNEGDQIELKTLDTPPTLSVDVQLSKDRMEAYLLIQKKFGCRFLVSDSLPVPKLKATAYSTGEIPPQPVSFAQVIERLHNKGVIYGINPEAIRQALDDQTKEIRVVVASGLMPRPAVDAEIVYKFPMDDQPYLQINPYGKGIITSVSIGEILATKKPAVAGVEGMDVTGQPVSPRPPKDEPIWIKKGIKLIKDGLTAVAIVDGRPVLEGQRRRYLSVLPVHVVNGDVNMEIGNITFKGDIVVTGGVLDGFKIEAGGNIEVYGDVHWSELFANGNIIVHKKVITSNIQAGGLSLTYKQINKILNTLKERVVALIQAIETVKRQPAFSVIDLEHKGEGHLVQLLMDFKFKDIPKEVAKLSAVIRETERELQPEVKEAEQLLTEKLCNLGPLRIREKSELTKLLHVLEQTIESVEIIVDSSCNVVVNYVQNSTIHGSGDLVITGQGSIASKLVAGGQILVQKGTVRGGQLTANKKIKVYELGSNNTSGVSINMLDDCQLDALLVHPVVIIQHNTETEVIDKKCNNLKAYIDQDGHLVVNK